jgi:biofilm PGA synthesis lipoprotein PgaB
MVWPYGAHSKLTVKIAEDHGMPITMTLKAGRNSLTDSPEVRRILVMSNPTLSDFVYEIEEEKPRQDPIRAIRLNLDDIYDKDPKKFTQNFDRLLDRIKTMKINTVYISAFSDADNDGYAEALYFPSRYLPTRADILNRVSWQIETRAGSPNHINVHMAMPITAFKNEHGLLSEQDILELYGDVAKFSYTEGLLFIDEKGAGTEGFVKKLIEKVKYYRSRVKKAAFLLSDQDVINTADQAEFWPQLQANYNAFVINVNPPTESAEAHIESLLQALPKEKNLDAFVFELQTVDKKTRKKIPEAVLSSEIDLLLQHKAIQLSHFPDDTPGDHPPLNLIKSKVSIRDFPFGD